MIHLENTTEQNAPSPPDTAVPIKPNKEKVSRRKPVYIYLAVLFTAAFILILWSFLMNHRSNQMVLSELKDNAILLQSTLERNNTLEAQVNELSSKLHRVQEEKSILENSMGDTQEDISAMEWLLSIVDAYLQQDVERTQSLIISFEETGLSAHLHDESSLESKETAVSPATLYQTIRSAVFVGTIPTEEANSEF